MLRNTLIAIAKSFGIYNFLRRLVRLVRRSIRKWTGRTERDNLERARLTTSCRDCDHLPRVENAGTIVRDNENGTYQIMHNGVKVLAGGYHGEWMAQIIRDLGGVHEPQEEKVFFEVLKYIRPQGIMVEVGCFWAYYSLWFRHGKPERRNYLIEPNRDKLDVGRRNFALNGFEGDFTLGFISSLEDKDAPFLDWDGRIDNSIRGIVLDEYIAEKNIDFIDILHADIQGAELDLLKCADRALRDHKIGYVFLSTHRDKHAPCLEFLLQQDFTIIAEHTRSESCSVDGLIAAQAPHVKQLPQIAITKLSFE